MIKASAEVEEEEEEQLHKCRVGMDGLVFPQKKKKSERHFRNAIILSWLGKMYDTSGEIPCNNCIWWQWWRYNIKEPK